MLKKDSIIKLIRCIWRTIKRIMAYLSYIKYFITKPNLKCGHNPVPITISFTTYPARVKWLPIVIGSIIRQSRRPDRVVLYLSKKQFPDSQNCILNRIKKQGVVIKYVDGDIRSHKKYFYAMQEYSGNLIITIDDDIIYDRNMIDDLYKSFIKHPKAVSAKRVHKITFRDDKSPKPYLEWEIDTKEKIDIESYDLIATGCGGVLYPPGCLDNRYLNKDIFIDKCLYADDLWLKIMELLNGTPVVLVKSKNYKLNHIWDTECNGLALENVDESGNDVQFEAICRHFNIELYALINNYILDKGVT